MMTIVGDPPVLPGDMMPMECGISMAVDACTMFIIATYFWSLIV